MAEQNKSKGNGSKGGSTDSGAKHGGEEQSPSRAFAVPAGPVDVTGIDPAATPVGPQSKADAAQALVELTPRLAELQERLYAQSTAGNPRSVLLILQGMDTAGKDGVIGSVLGMVDPDGVHFATFKKPTQEELTHDFLWRIEKQVPEPGFIGVFNRSQYEDVLVARVRELVPESVWSKRYEAINDFEKKLTERDVTVVKCFLHISKEVQKERLLARLEDPTKYWKYNPGDVDERAYWDAYQAAYSAVLEKCGTQHSPWQVIPSDRKWYRNWAVAALLTQTLQTLDPAYPPAEFDVEVEKVRVQHS
ncbi:MAG TPA: polyphosphate kinase 2 family protein [Nakamurella sp.]|nr:polyphosphate kinase 2 family protein [Nakamurella sp.]